MSTEDPEVKEDTIKQVIVIRKDLKMQRGKEIAQGSHASMAFISKRLEKMWTCHYELYLTPEEEIWLYNERFTKITLQIDSEKGLDDIYQAAKNAGLEVNVIVDSGATVFHGVPTKTCLAIGPDRASKIDPITKNLKLY